MVESNWSPDRKRQYVLEQAILQNISHVQDVMRSLRWALDGHDDDFEERQPVSHELIETEIEKAKVSILLQLEGLLKSVTLSYKESVQPQSNEP